MTKQQLFLRINNLTKNYYKNHTLEDLHSEDGWLMLVERSIPNITEGKKSKFPNIRINDVPQTKPISSEINNVFNISIDYNSRESVDWFINLNQPANQNNLAKIQTICSSFSDSQTTRCDKSKIGEAGSKGIHEISFPTSSIDILNEIELIVKRRQEIKQIKKEQNLKYTIVMDSVKYNWVTPIIILIQFKNVTLEKFDELFLRIWDTFLTCIKLQSGTHLKQTNKQIEECIEKISLAKKINNKRLLQKFEDELEQLYNNSDLDNNELENTDDCDDSDLDNNESENTDDCDE